MSKEKKAKQNEKELRALALSLPETSEAPHFEKTSFRVNKKIFATYDSKKDQACLKFSEIDQDVFSKIQGISPVPNKWGKQGWTFIQLEKVNNEILMDALKQAYCEVAPKNLAQIVRDNENDEEN